ncbi:MAG TPA: amino acid racemase [Rhizomicrobium sp.]|jgi:aspartate racemase|nr:amino acid racemase [Rhizomicrobium sp.]
MNKSEKTVGVIGGMGPEATVEFMRRLVAAVPAKDDADHLHVIADNNPKIPSRIKALIEKTGEDPTPVLIDMARKLQAAGADFLTIPCNTAHYYLPEIAKAVSIPVLDVVDLTIAKLSALDPKPTRIGMLASTAVRLVGLFERRFATAGLTTVFPDEETEAHLLDLIRAVKAGQITPSHKRTYEAIAKRLVEDGAYAFLVACTELSLLPKPDVIPPVFDTLDVLVEATVRAARS